jgi:hypothetical protein
MSGRSPGSLHCNATTSAANQQSREQEQGLGPGEPSAQETLTAGRGDQGAQEPTAKVGSQKARDQGHLLVTVWRRFSTLAAWERNIA